MTEAAQIPKKLTLYDVTVEGLELERLLSDADGELTPELEARFDVFLKGGKEKIDAACKVVRSLEASSLMCQVEAERLSDRAVSFEHEAKRLEDRILAVVDAAFDGKVKTNLFTVWGQNSGPSVSIELAPDADLVQMAETFPDLVRHKYELDKAKAKSMRAQGVALPGAVTVTESEPTRYLRIK